MHAERAQPHPAPAPAEASPATPAAEGGVAAPAVGAAQGEAGSKSGNRNRHRDRRDRRRGRGERDNRDSRAARDLPDDDDGEDAMPEPQRAPLALPPDFPTYSLADLKKMPAHKLLDIADQLGIGESVARLRKQDVTFALLKMLTRHGDGVAADGVLEILPDGFGFLRSADASYLAGPDDTYISPSQIR
ncbi:MAG TPA: Rho termination factor N-terminal domain-containing protein, partial [Chiayiivirga sp.]|nr:Rho termination factor N-terminal domain-containing protein [Chiayiivirga sp.]